MEFVMNQWRFPADWYSKEQRAEARGAGYEVRNNRLVRTSYGFGSGRMIIPMLCGIALLLLLVYMFGHHH